MLIITPGPTPPENRRGAILLVVITMLVLFAAVALAFVYYATAESTASRYGREAQTAFRADMDPELALSYFLGKLIYGDVNDETGVWSALRGHDLARGVYGYADAFVTPTPTLPPPSPQPGFYIQAGFNTTPFNGLGRVHTAPANPAVGATNPFGADDFPLINYTFFQSDNFLRDPEHLGMRNSLNASLLAPGSAANAFVGGANPGYTYPDLNTMCLAAVNAKGEVLMQSFHRPWTGIGSLDPSSPNWQANPALLQPAPAGDPTLKYKTLRPLPAYHNVPGKSSFPPPADAGGDVCNLEGFLGVPVPGQAGKYFNNDSIWIDIGFPVLTAPDGRKYKPLFAAAIVDLDGKINLNTCGNIRGSGQAQVSNQGWGPWEVSLARAMMPNGQWKNIFLGANGVKGRYGPDGQPSASGSIASPGEAPRFYGPVDFDATNAPNYQPSLKVLRPGDAGNPNNTWVPFLYYPPTTYSNGDTYERTNHPLNFNFFTPGGDDRIFSAREMEALLRYRGTGSPALKSDLFNLCPNDFISQDRFRRLLTTHSFDLSAPGAMPWLGASGQPDGSYQLDTTVNPPIPRSTPPQSYTFPGSAPPSVGEFEIVRRAATAILGRVNINQTLPNYPAVDSTQGKITDAAAFQAATLARQNLAQDIWNRLCWVTTGQQAPSAAALTTMQAGNPGQYAAFRWLAQLAVNIVDYRDIDDYSTPFHWHNDSASPANGWVYGVEIPRLVLNEAYVEVDNDPADPGLLMAKKVATLPYKVNFWVELHNPLLNDTNLQDPVGDTNNNNAAIYSAARLRMPALGGNQPYSIHRLIITKGPQSGWTPTLTDPANTRGDVGQDISGTIKRLIVEDFVPELPPTPQPANGVNTDYVLPANNSYAGPNGSNQGFYVLGPKYDFPRDLTQQNPPPNYPSATLRVKDQQLQDPMQPVPNLYRSSMSYEPAAVPLPIIQVNDDVTMPKTYTIVLQRLACSFLPCDNNPVSQTYNPYITVDYLDNIPAYNGLQADVAGLASPTTFANRKAWGRKQPYASFSDIAFNGTTMRWEPQGDSQIWWQTPDSDNDPTNDITPDQFQPQHTMFRTNAVENAKPNDLTQPFQSLSSPNYGSGMNPGPQTLAVPFDWLTHLDRQLVNPMELLSVSACRPTELTRLFMFGQGANANPATTPFNHLAPWRNAQSRLYRFLEFMTTASRAAGVADTKVNPSGRQPGLLNINTCWDQEILDALLDPQAATYFPGLSVGTLLQSRSPAGAPGGTDRPFLPLSAPFLNGGDPQFPNGVGVTDTVLRTDPTDATKPLFGVNATTQRNPYLQNEMLQKIFGNVTTRSNVFAVWVTVGFFEVTDETARPVKLGAEIGKAENRNVRHRMFAIIDRSSVAAPATLTKLALPIVPLGTAQPAVVDAVNGSATAPPPLGITMNWTIQANSTVAVGNIGDPNRETVTVTAVGPGPTFQAVFTKPHQMTDPVMLVGQPGPTIPNFPTVLANPGPQQRYDPRRNSAVVLHFNIIE